MSLIPVPVTDHIRAPSRIQSRVPQPQAPPAPPVRLLPTLPKLTHILCIPLHHSPTLTQNLKSFHHHLAPLNLPPATLPGVKTLHLRICDLSLTTPEKLRRAQELLSHLNLGSVLNTTTNPPSRASPPLRISLKGLFLPDGQSPDYARTLFTRPHDPTGRLQRFAESLKAIFTNENLAVDWPNIKVAWREPDPDEVWRVDLDVKVLDMVASPVWGDTRDIRGVMSQKGIENMVFAEEFVVGGVGIWERRNKMERDWSGKKQEGLCIWGGKEVGFKPLQERARL